MDISTAANVINALAVSAGVIFAATQVRDFRQQRRRDSMLHLARSFQDPAFVHGLYKVIELPDNASAEQIRELLGPEGEEAVNNLMAIWETLGALVYQNELTLQVVDDFYSGPLAISWQKLRPYVEDLRRRYQRETWSEWFQWIAERLAERESKEAALVPAHVAHAPGTATYERWRRIDAKG